MRPSLHKIFSRRMTIITLVLSAMVAIVYPDNVAARGGGNGGNGQSEGQGASASSAKAGNASATARANASASSAVVQADPVHVEEGYTGDSYRKWLAGLIEE